MASLKLGRKEETWSIEVIVPICGASGGEKLMILLLSSEKPANTYSTVLEEVFEKNC